MSEYAISIASNMGIIAFVALSAYVILVAGEISFGQQAYFGIGAYVSGVATAMWGWPFALALFLGSCVAALAALAVGALTLRLRVSVRRRRDVVVCCLLIEGSFPVFSERAEPDVFPGLCEFILSVVFAPPLCCSDMDPSGRLVGDP